MFDQYRHLDILSSVQLFSIGHVHKNVPEPGLDWVQYEPRGILGITCMCFYPYS